MQSLIMTVDHSSTTKNLPRNCT